jgi:hypothetical protein
VLSDTVLPVELTLFPCVAAAFVARMGHGSFLKNVVVFIFLCVHFMCVSVFFWVAASEGRQRGLWFWFAGTDGGQTVEHQIKKLFDVPRVK